MLDDTKEAMEADTIQWPREKGQTAIYKTLHRKPKIEATGTPLKTGDKLRCSGRLSSSCSNGDIRRAIFDGATILWCMQRPDKCKL